MKRFDFFIIFTISVLVLLLACINFVTEIAIYEQSNQLNQNLTDIQADILENMMGDYLSGLEYVDQIAVDSDSRMIEATLKVMDYLIQSAVPGRQEDVLKTFAADSTLPLALYHKDTQQFTFLNQQKTFYVIPNRTEEALKSFSSTDFVMFEDTYIEPDKTVGKQRTFFYKSHFTNRIFVTVIDFSKSSDLTKAVTQAEMNHTFSQLEKTSGNPIIAVNRNGVVQLSSDLKTFPLGLDLTQNPGNEQLLQIFSDLSDQNQHVHVMTPDLKKFPKGINAKWFKMDSLYILVSYDPKDIKDVKSKQFFAQRLMLFFSVAAIIMVIVLMRRNFMYYVETNELEEVGNE